MLVRHQDDFLRGLTVLDIKMIQDRILDKVAFTDWQEAAADFNESGYVSAMDIVEMRRLLLGITEIETEANPPWVFALKEKHEHYSKNFQVDVNLNSGDMKHYNITAAKRGDVNGDAMINDKGIHPFIINYSLDQIEPTQSILSIYCDDLVSVEAIQLFVDVLYGTILSVETPNEFYTSHTDNSFSTINYNYDQSTDPQPISINILHEAWEKPQISFSQKMPSLLYNRIGQEFSIQFYEDKSRAYIEKNRSFLIYPNPVSNDSFIAYSGDQYEGEIQISISSVTGQKVLERIFINNSTDEIFPLQLPDIAHPGVYFVAIQLGEHIFSGKIIKN